MIAKLIVHGEDRDEAVRRLAQALRQYEIVGVATNLTFLAAIAGHPAYGAGLLDTGFIERHRAELFRAPGPAGRVALAAATLRVIADDGRATAAQAGASADPWSPWNSGDAWRLNGDGYQDLGFREGETTLAVRAHLRPGHAFRADLPDGPAELGGDIDAGIVIVDGVRHRARAVRNGAEITILSDGVQHRLAFVDPLAPSAGAEGLEGRLVAPMPGRITQVLVEPGAAVTRGTPLMVLEAMKMEHTIAAPADGTVETLRYRAGDLVEEGADLVGFVPAS